MYINIKIWTFCIFSEIFPTKSLFAKNIYWIMKSLFMELHSTELWKAFSGNIGEIMKSLFGKLFYKKPQDVTYTHQISYNLAMSFNEILLPGTLSWQDFHCLVPSSYPISLPGARFHVMTLRYPSLNAMTSQRHPGNHGNHGNHGNSCYDQRCYGNYHNNHCLVLGSCAKKCAKKTAYRGT